MARDRLLKHIVDAVLEVQARIWQITDESDVEWNAGRMEGESSVRGDDDVKEVDAETAVETLQTSLMTIVLETNSTGAENGRAGVWETHGLCRKRSVRSQLIEEEGKQNWSGGLSECCEMKSFLVGGQWSGRGFAQGERGKRGFIWWLCYCVVEERRHSICAGASRQGRSGA